MYIILYVILCGVYVCYIVWCICMLYCVVCMYVILCGVHVCHGRWTVPEEFRIWKEKMDMIALKKKVAASSSSSSNNNVPVEEAHGNTVEALNEISTTTTTTTTTNSNGSDSHQLTHAQARASAAAQHKAESAVPVVYKTPEEAEAAFKELLTEHNISAVMKMKEVQDLCSSDPRWNALKTAGERKQGLAVYQVLPFQLYIYIQYMLYTIELTHLLYYI